MQMRHVKFLVLFIITSTLALAVIADVLPKKYIITIEGKDEEWHLKSVKESSLQYKKNPIETPNSHFTIFSFRNELLKEGKFFFADTITYDSFNPEDLGGYLQLDEYEFSIEVPYFAEAASIILESDDQRKTLDVDVSNFAACNQNTVCEAEESPSNCIHDCYDPDSYCFNGIMNINMESGVDCGGMCDKPCSISKQEFLEKISNWISKKVVLSEIFSLLGVVN